MTLKDVSYVRGKLLARFLWKTQSRRRRAKNARNPNINRTQCIIISAAPPTFVVGCKGGGGGPLVGERSNY